MNKHIIPFSDLSREASENAGGKGAALAKLFQKGYPVPDGFVILPEAFQGDDLKAESWIQAQALLAGLRKKDKQASFAVRSSALSEDSAGASFAGEFETVLDVHSNQRIKDAIFQVRGSRNSERVKAYSQAKGLEVSQELAVVVQKLVRADYAGILFTCDPVSGSQLMMTGNYVHGFGEELVSGEVEPYTFTLTRPKGVFQGPEDFKKFAKKLFRLGTKLIRDMDGQQDIEFAIKNGRIYLLQSRPITTLAAYDPKTGKWNDSLTGDYLWSRNNFGEGRPDVMTPYTWSLTNYFWQDLSLIPGYLYAGNIGGRFYANISTMVSMTTLFGKSLEAGLEEVSGALGRAPDGMEIPVIPFPKNTFFAVLPKILSLASKQSKGRKKIPTYLTQNPVWCQNMNEKLKNTKTYQGLFDFWFEDLEPYIKESMMIFFAASDPYEQAMKLHRELVSLVGEGDANALFLNFSDTRDYIASLGPLVGISKLARGEISRQSYLEKYGHRGPHEAEYSIPRPIEDPTWLDRQLEEYHRSPVDVEALLARQEQAFEEAWSRLEKAQPGKIKRIKKRLAKVPDAARLRESVRSESMRMAGIQRGFAVRAGEVTGLGQDIFFLSISEILALLSGKEYALQYIPARKKTYQDYCELPSFPMIIRGRFDPAIWAADPRRRSDIYDASATYDSPASNTLNGFAGAAGRVEASVRVLDSPEQSGDLKEGEILVAVSTNIGWTPIFLRAAAVITDVGAPLSHAAIVARELGIPAVVGCGNATMRLRTGDKVRVDGGLGSVEILN